MNTEEKLCGPHDVSDEEGRAELERLLGDQRFHGTERAKSILRYLAERHFQGCPEAVKAYTIALDVLGRGADFDASSDPIVRIEMSRLRSVLNQYYEAFGETSGITIRLPIGRYLVEFSRTDPAGAPVFEKSEEEAPIAVVEEVGETAKIFPMTQRTPHLYAGGAAALLFAAVISTVAVCYGRAPAMTVRPSVTLAISAPDDANAKEADTTEDYLVTALSRFRTLTISSLKTIETGATSRSATGISNAYDIQMKYYSDGDVRSVWWRVVGSGGAGVLKSGVDSVEVGGRSDTVVRDELVSLLAKRFASTRGVINILEARDGTATDVIGNTCVLKAEYELDEGGRNGIRDALPCLEQTVALQPGNADALAVLSRIIVAAEGGDPATTPFERALTLANRAAALDPTSDRAQVAIMMAQFYAGRTDAALAAGNQALALNRDNPDVLAKLSGVLYSSGFRDAAVSLAEEAERDVDAVPRDARIVLALDAYARGDYSNASLVSEQINCGDIVVRAIRAASLGEMSSPQASAGLEYLKAALPDYRTSLRQKMQWRRYPSGVIASLEQGLEKASRLGGLPAVAAAASN
ncbi:MAG: hypothetical protein PW735_03180 [Acidobacteriaceae bacterium]|nr:hypothetical protein [Acidobacteriaceae bacterium]